MSLGEKVGIAIGLFPFGWELLGLPNSRFVGIVCWAVCVVIFADVLRTRFGTSGTLRQHAALLLPGSEIVLCCIGIVVLAWFRLNVPLSPDALRPPELPSTLSPPRAPRIQEVRHPAKSMLPGPAPTSTLPPEKSQPASVSARPNPLDPYDGAPDSKVSEDAIQEATKFENSARSCMAGLEEATNEDAARKDSGHAEVESFMFREQASVWDYADDLNKLHTSLIYRVGMAERDARYDRELSDLLSKDPRMPFNCWVFRDLGDYFYALGTKLKARGN